MPVTRIYRYFCDEMFFFYNFINQFPKIDGTVYANNMI